ncbi:MAG: DUF1425 domain-containing protein, partial [Planctomycetes bacterium]|nr:DUF1425 domain-containing protein [Planctomycetota bacterium]
MKTITNILLFAIVLAFAGCNEQQDSRIHLGEGVKSDNLIDNVVTRPVAYAFSVLAGEGIDIEKAVMKRNATGLLELHVNGFNRSYDVRRFRYKVEWLDADGLVLQNRTSVWMRTSAAGKSPFAIKV